MKATYVRACNPKKKPQNPIKQEVLWEVYISYKAQSFLEFPRMSTVHLLLLLSSLGDQSHLATGRNGNTFWSLGFWDG